MSQPEKVKISNSGKKLYFFYALSFPHAESHSGAIRTFVITKSSENTANVLLKRIAEQRVPV